jgi:hypothetical protein
MRKLRFFPGHNPQTKRLAEKRNARASDYFEQRKGQNDSRLARQAIAQMRSDLRKTERFQKIGQRPA